jgi:hypothetical protein
VDRVIDDHALYDCHDLLFAHKQALFDHLVGRRRDLFNVSFDVLLYDLTSTYFEVDPPLSEGDKRQFVYSRDRRPEPRLKFNSINMVSGFRRALNIFLPDPVTESELVARVMSRRIS